jgi:flagellin
MQAQQTAQEAKVRQQVTDTLKTSVLAGAEALINKYYGLSGDGTNVKIDYDQNVDGALAQVTFQYDSSGKIVNPHLHLNMSQMTPDTSSNGTNDHVIQNDRIIAHEMTHLIMGRNMNLAALPDWFAEGTAEYIAGGAERVGLSLRVQSPRQLLSRLLQPWEGTSDDYSAGYLAVRFLDQATADGGGLKAIMARLKAGDSLDTAIATVSQGQYAGADDFIRAFATDGSGVAFIRSIDLSGRDAGSIKPGSGPQVVPDSGTRTDQPLQGFHLQWPSPLEGMNLSFPQAAWGFGFTSVQAASQAYLRQTGSRGSSMPI